MTEAPGSTFVPDRSLAGQVAIVTGGAWNLGRAVAERLAAGGASVVVVSRNAANVHATAAAIRSSGGCATGLPADVTDAAQVEAVVQQTVAAHRRIDILAAFAGGGGAEAPLDTVPAAALERVVSVNLIGALYSARAVLPVLRRQGEGLVLFCAGGGAFFPMPAVHAAAYASAKAALCRLADQLQAELLDTALRINAIEPGPVPLDDRAAARPAAELVAFLASREGHGVRGRVLAASDDWWRDPETVRRIEKSATAYRLRRVEDG